MFQFICHFPFDEKLPGGIANELEPVLCKQPVRAGERGVTINLEGRFEHSLQDPVDNSTLY